MIPLQKSIKCRYNVLMLCVMGMNRECAAGCPYWAGGRCNSQEIEGLDYGYETAIEMPGGAETRGLHGQSQLQVLEPGRLPLRETR